MNGALYKNNYFRAAFFYYECPKRFYRNDCKSVFSRIFRYEHCFFGAYFKIQQLIIMTINGLIQGCLPIMRFNYGAGNLKRLQSVFRYSTILVTSLMMFGTLIIMLFPTQILSLFMASEKCVLMGLWQCGLWQQVIYFAGFRQ